MRRIARPLWVTQSSLFPCSTWQAYAQSPYTPLRPATAAFSTTPPRSFLLPGKQDKKKHQQFVRRWQKRLLGDSEPIGAHVDPYDPTSPIRIAPEEQGEYEEVLDDVDEGIDKSIRTAPSYKPARKARNLVHVGGEQWHKQTLERDLACEFEKLTLRTYTPLSLDMASDIEQLTGTWYTLKDENLHMAQTMHHETGRPYTAYNFGLRRKINQPLVLRSRFAQAIAEIYTLKQAGLDMDLSKFANCGVYNTPPWVKKIKLTKTESGQDTLIFPRGKDADQLLQVMKTVPGWESNQGIEDELLLVEEDAGELPIQVGQNELPSQIEQPESPTIDPDTLAFKRAALVRTDPDKKPFDFMSNRPAPRSKLVKEVKAAEATKVEKSSLQPTLPVKSSSLLAEMIPAVEGSHAAISQMHYAVFEHQAQRLTKEILALRRALQLHDRTPEIETTRWQHIPLTDLGIKFALSKRLLQLTGIRMTDPQLTSASTLGDLYGYLCENAKPQPTTLFSAIHVDGQKARTRSNQQQQQKQQQQQSTQESPVKRRADLGDLITLGNVSIRRVKPTKQEMRKQIGLDKVIHYALRERGLVRPSPFKKPHRKAKKKSRILQET